jgi:hypothetical protein
VPVQSSGVFEDVATSTQLAFNYGFNNRVSAYDGAWRCLPEELGLGFGGLTNQPRNLESAAAVAGRGKHVLTSNVAARACFTQIALNAGSYRATLGPGLAMGLNFAHV